MPRMQRILQTISAAFCVSLALPLAAQDFNWKENAAKHWKSSYDFTYTVVNAMPADAFLAMFRPRPLNPRREITAG
ncbi:MAG TPA: hypothetical protein VMG40_16380 [Bryobacteraceae bacterium]|nr:hypothetical protein [Bryobacteraceae bacterium]